MGVWTWKSFCSHPRHHYEINNDRCQQLRQLKQPYLTGPVTGLRTFLSEISNWPSSTLLLHPDSEKSEGSGLNHLFWWLPWWRRGQHWDIKASACCGSPSSCWGEKGPFPGREMHQTGRLCQSPNSGASGGGGVPRTHQHTSVCHSLCCGLFVVLGLQIKELGLSRFKCYKRWEKMSVVNLFLSKKFLSKY